MTGRNQVQPATNWRVMVSLGFSPLALALLIAFIAIGEFWMLGLAGVLVLFCVAASLSLREEGRNRQGLERVAQWLSFGVGGLVFLCILLVMVLSFFSD